MQAQTQDQHNGLAGTNGHRSDEPAYPELFKPITIGKCKIPNRIVMAPMNVLMSQGNLGYVNDQQLAYYAARAKGGTGLIITECVLGTRLASQFPYTSNLHLFDNSHLAGPVSYTHLRAHETRH